MEMSAGSKGRVILIVFHPLIPPGRMNFGFGKEKEKVRQRARRRSDSKLEKYNERPEGHCQNESC